MWQQNLIAVVVVAAAVFAAMFSPDFSSPLTRD
jgi:hypothetical protein